MIDMLRHPGWLIDVVDIGAIAFIIYRVVLLLKGTMLLRLLAALACIFGINLFSRFLGLRTLGALLDNLLGSLFIILVIIFQHEIRRALVTTGRRVSGTGHDREGSSDVIEETISAAEALASKKIGALIVFEREMPLENFMAVGTEIDAKVTSELITSIFLPYSPIHDGAVIIQKGKLTKAGCFLPLTQNPEVSKALGTRHRAAIGLTEIVDAAVVVVSEETGKISVVISGRITRDLDPATLRKVLRKVLELRRPK